jgi:hypothetical protein
VVDRDRRQRPHGRERRAQAVAGRVGGVGVAAGEPAAQVAVVQRGVEVVSTRRFFAPSAIS